MPTTHIVFVGTHKDRLIESISALREIPFSKLLLIVGEDKALPGEHDVRRVAKQIQSELKMLWEIEIHTIDKRSVLKATNQLFTIIAKENLKRNEVFLNITSAFHTLSIGAYIAACMTRSKIITSIPKYDDNGEEIGIEDVIEIPVIPVDYPGEEQRQIITHIQEGVESLDSIIYMINPNIQKESKEFRSERSRLSHHLSKLEDSGFITKRKRGRNISIRLTELGKMLSDMVESKLV
ncbi:MAG: transcriptional regulator [Methanocalculus sp. MSAO_Arc2]|uniref:HFX_2341 family transcriptional regulator domain-containing protein n=1 Tax=Methanocalculus sp. MSAO_Arc2 TaxID=2293855 RepID=UPI000FEFB40E|nr:MAG: transcriptional regulator [Methanocalculus sp. MSAO_Arc2]